MNYPDSVRFLYSLGNEIKTAKFGLERIARLMAEFGHPEKRPARYVHVAGTNGKGSTCAVIESGLRAAGWRTGLYTSPHLHEPTERIRINGDPVTAAEFAGAFDRVHNVAMELVTRGEIDEHPTYFETVTAMAFVLFRERGAEIVVLETGLGGRLDATNIVEPELCVITPVDWDHEKFLGTSIESIAAEKAGIIKPGVPVLMTRQRFEAEGVICERARALNAPVLRPWKATRVECFRESSQIESNGLQLECRLAGRHQVENALAAAAALEHLHVSPEAIEQGLRAARWPGRLERLHRDPEIIVDGAHNPAGARALACYVNEFYVDPKPVLVFGVMRDKSVEEMTEILFPHFRTVIATAPAQGRALAPEAFREITDHADLRIAETLPSALAMASLAAEQDSAVFVSGSLFLGAEARDLFR